MTHELPPDAAIHQAILMEIAVKGRSILRSEGMTDADIDAAINRAGAGLTDEPSLSIRRANPRFG